MERERCNKTPTITRTTVYDSKAGGFITSVTTETEDSEQDHSEPGHDEEDCQLERGDAEKLILSQETYNTLTKVGKKTVSFLSREEPQEKMKGKHIPSCESSSLLELLIIIFYEL